MKKYTYDDIIFDPSKIKLEDVGRKCYNSDFDNIHAFLEDVNSGEYEYEGNEFAKIDSSNPRYPFKYKTNITISSLQVFSNSSLMIFKDDSKEEN